MNGVTKRDDRTAHYAGRTAAEVRVIVRTMGAAGAAWGSSTRALGAECVLTRLDTPRIGQLLQTADDDGHPTSVGAALVATGAGIPSPSNQHHPYYKSTNTLTGLIKKLHIKEVEAEYDQDLKSAGRERAEARRRGLAI